MQRDYAVGRWAIPLCTGCRTLQVQDPGRHMCGGGEGACSQGRLSLNGCPFSLRTVCVHVRNPCGCDVDVCIYRAMFLHRVQGLLLTHGHGLFEGMFRPHVVRLLDKKTGCILRAGSRGRQGAWPGQLIIVQTQRDPLSCASCFSHPLRHEGHVFLGILCDERDLSVFATSFG